MNQNSPIVFICKAIPFDNGGSATVIRNLLSNSLKGQFFVMGREPKTHLDYKNTEIPYEYALLPLSDGKKNKIIKLFLFIKSILIAIIQIKKIKAEKIIGVYRDETSFLLSYFVSLILNKDLYIYLTDLYAENYTSSLKKMIQKLVFKRAKKIFCLNEGMQKVYKDLYGLNPIVLQNCININNSFKPQIVPNNPFVILFSGTILYDRLDLLQNLVYEFRDNNDYRIHFLSPHNETFFIQNNLIGPNISHSYFNDQSEMMKSLHSADLLYLPLTFAKANDYRTVLQLTSCLATKSFDYMQSSVPILVHCPQEYFTYQFFEKRNAAILLGSNENVSKVINEIKYNYSEYYKITENAFNSLKNNDSKIVLEKLTKEINKK